ncbi:MAG: PSD1 and planctomycete cytochrome C domain-containing protein [Verrucomicrobiota bacterium]|nr:PSD1 and planctomycete cytochrome C domain-containing protein [Verrucomicrobiota bacterium]
MPKRTALPHKPLGVATLLCLLANTVDGETISFNRDIRPILSDKCYACHGPDENTRKADLRLDIEANAFVPHGNYDAAILKGKPEDSPLYQRITTDDSDDIMPPLDSHKELSEEEKRLIGQWIKEGAEWEGHWAFEKPEKPEEPELDWGNNTVDAFIYRSMQAKGLEPNPEADRPTLARRLALDLTGLPPHPEMVDRFVNDPSKDAYESLVDELLGSPAYGEHQARYWLDAARYADTHGLHLDNYREIWPYRDWVTKAFNENKPFDEFTIEQIAGDLLPDSTLEQTLATGFNRCNPTTSEGGAIDAEYRAVYAKDRVETTSTVFLGLTMGCASCHDHKFDPLSMADFYRFSAFFNNFDGPIMDGNAYDTRPIVTIPKPEHRNSWIQVKERKDEISNAIRDLKEEWGSKFAAWKANAERPYQSYNFNIEPDFVIDFAREGSESDKKKSKSDVLNAMTGDSIDLAAHNHVFNPDQAFTLSCKVKLPVEGEYKQDRVPVLEQFDGDRGWRLSVANSNPGLPNRYQIIFELIHSLKGGNMISVTTAAERTNPREFSSPEITIAYDGSSSVAGLSISTGSRQPFDYEKVVDNLSGSVAVTTPLQAGLFADGLIDPALAAKSYKTGYYDKSAEGPKTGHIESIKVYDRLIHGFELAGGGSKSRIETIFKVPEERRRRREKDQLSAYYYTNFVPQYRILKFEEAENNRLYNHIYDQSTVSLVMNEKDSPPHAFILERGEYDKPGEKVFADIPESLGGLPASSPKNRMGLAQWLVDSDNPLTARVTVNRFWQNIFGTGIVATSEDFGIMGENPTYPELLDWLAIRFQESGWNVKDFLKLLVMSATYRQDSKIDSEELALDPENRYLARGPRYRLDGEVLRDKALYVSGSLNGQIGGPPVKPYQPGGIWNAVAYSDSNTAHFFQDHGDDLYRRSLYTFWKRTAPPPNMVVFDVPSRENCNVRRERTNTPLQALTLMNDKQYVEAARRLAERAMGGGQSDIGERIATMYRHAFGSDASPKHQSILEASYQKFQSSFAEKRSGAESLIQVGDSTPNPSLDPIELASLTMVANQIMNLDSFVNKY